MHYGHLVLPRGGAYITLHVRRAVGGHRRGCDRHWHCAASALRVLVRGGLVHPQECEPVDDVGRGGGLPAI